MVLRISLGDIRDACEHNNRVRTFITANGGVKLPFPSQFCQINALCRIRSANVPAFPHNFEQVEPSETESSAFLCSLLAESDCFVSSWALPSRRLRQTNLMSRNVA